MADAPEELLAAVRDQAEARVRMDVQGVAKYLTSEAVDTLRASFPGVPPRVASYEIDKHEPRGVDHVFDVRYSARDVSFIVRSRWRPGRAGRDVPPWGGPLPTDDQRIGRSPPIRESLPASGGRSPIR